MNKKEVDKAFNDSWLQINKELNVFNGLWPNRPNGDKIFRRFIVLTVLITVTLPHVLGIVMQCGSNMALCGENVCGFCYCSGVIAKFIVPIVSKKKFVTLYEKIALNWKDITDPYEQSILEEFSKLGRLKTWFYFVYCIVAGFAFCQMTALPALMDIIQPLNESRPKILVTKAEYPFNPFDYYYELYFIYCTAAVVSVSVLVSTDSTYSVIIHQSLGIFSIVNHRLQKAAQHKNPDESYRVMVSAIKLHKSALQFLELIESTYQSVFLMFIFVTVAFLSFGSLIIVEHSEEIIDLIRMTMMELGAMIHIFFISWPGQLVIDHSENLFLSTYTTKWYNMSMKGKILLQFMMMRCFKPSFLTAGGFYIMNFENYGSIVKTTLSYVTVALSFH
ncbi:odorant receptor 153 [Nasonia vitripennis]|uniref:Odorant receptor n=1 Tax=Nasonia vitripennis TaxID=7425 RepID=A0A7M6UWB7_NASVI|nr:odorant receptor 153 [Nasonia vitripennis]